ncbi:hypothetical protein [Pseudoxanthomonas winnipegensis]|uniref:Uncharacterized protein n=1 Tax=Pseudoxanthomonas winnipegensis TaxID=2480810 RepID=A0A4Q8M3Y2_9GAMM|nr:hypothetical protein [Pseudoxanthomonas winnipegensis]TAA40150.1 hypothetical protein EA655_13410 [Pseudoxanthomonas winnipegensis]
MQNDPRIADLRRRRDETLKAEENNVLRREHGPKLVQALSAATKYDLNIESFDVGKFPPFSLDWNGKLEDAGGLVKAYVNEEEVRSLLFCMERRSSCADGYVGILNNDYLGLSLVTGLSLQGMVESAQRSEDSVVFYPEGGEGAVVVDYYPSSPGDGYSVLVQGGKMIELFKECFVD